MKVTIAILFCDKDYIFIPDLLNLIEDNIEIDYDIILIDNRTVTRDYHINTKDYPIYSYGYNAYQLMGRKLAVEKATGDYIWFVDADDEVLYIPKGMQETVDKGYDIICFNYLSGTEELFFEDNKIQENHLETNLINSEFFNQVGNMCWNKFIKRTVLEKVEDHVTEDVFGIASEDMLLVLGSLKYGKSLYFNKEYVYKYITNRSCSAAIKYTNLEQFSRIIFGHNEVTKIILEMLSVEELDKFGITEIFLQDCTFFLSKLNICDEDILKDCIQIIIDTFSKEIIISSWREKLWLVNKWKKSRFLKVREILQNIFPENKDEFIVCNEIVYYTTDDDGNPITRSEIRENEPFFIPEDEELKEE